MTDVESAREGRHADLVQYLATLWTLLDARERRDVDDAEEAEWAEALELLWNKMTEWEQQLVEDIFVAIDERKEQEA